MLHDLLEAKRGFGLGMLAGVALYTVAFHLMFPPRRLPRNLDEE